MKPIPFRSAGVVLPLSSIRTERDWGLGQLTDLGAAARKFGAAGFSWISLLPLNEVAPGLTSPYSAVSSFALDPIYLDLDDIEEVVALGGREALDAADRRALEAAHQAPRVDFMTVRACKSKLLWRAFIRFELGAGTPGTPEMRAFEDFRGRARDWLEDDALFHVLKDANAGLSWRLWPIELRERRPAAMEAAAQKYARLCRYYEWIQWHAAAQLQRARDEMRAADVLLAGDLPFALSEESAEVWKFQRDLDFDATLGTPPDAFAPEGQNWGLPAYDWGALAADGYRWLASRVRWAAHTFDLLRLDHAAGYFRTWIWPKSGAKAHYTPSDVEGQISQGVEIIQLFGQMGVSLMAEDLGDVPEFVRVALGELGVPGMRVLRWEIDSPSGANPEDWPVNSVAMGGTHDTSPLSLWWESLAPGERRKFCQLRGLQSVCGRPAFDGEIQLALLSAIARSGSRLALFPVEDVFGLREQINRPGTLSEDNWSFRLPWTLESLWSEALPRHLLEEMARLLEKSARVPAGQTWDVLEGGAPEAPAPE